MKKRYKVVLNVEIEDPEKPYPAGGDYTHKNRLDGLILRLLADVHWPSYGETVTLDKIIDKGEVQ